MAQYETVYAMIVVIGMLGFVLDAAFEQLRGMAGRLGRARASRRRRLDMTATRAGMARSSSASLPIALLLALWFVLATFGLRRPSLLPRPQTVFAAACCGCCATRSSCRHCAVTLFRLFAGFVIAVVLGVALGIAAAGNRAVAAALTPLVRVLAPVPKIALYPAFILILGLRACLQDRAGGADAVFPILLATYQGAIAVEPKLVWSARAAGALARRAAC